MSRSLCTSRVSAAPKISPGVTARRAPGVLESLNSEGETRQWRMEHSCARVRVAVEDEEQRSVTEPASDIGLSAASTSITPQVALALSACMASTSNTKVVVQSARFLSKFTFNTAGQRLALEGTQRPEVWLVWHGTVYPADMTWASHSLESPRCTCTLWHRSLHSWNAAG
jgi:hypothetical protein